MKRPDRIVIPVILSICTLLTGQYQKGQIQPGAIPEVHHHYQSEYSAPVFIDTIAWKALEEDLYLSFASTNRAYFNHEIPDIDISKSWKGTGWKGERLNSKILLWSKQPIRQIRFKKNHLINSAGDTLKLDHIRLFPVHYVLSDYPYAAENGDCWTGHQEKKNAYLLPDILKPVERFTLEENSARPVWLMIDIPRTCKAGLYTGALEIEAIGVKEELEIQVNVQDYELPEPADWKFRLDLWQNPVVVARHFHLEPWSDEHKMLLKKHLKHYADAGGKVITTYAVHSPWTDNSYTIEEAMIESIKLNDATWTFDYQIFDDYVELAMDAGITEAITIYTLLPWAHRFRYYDVKSDNYLYDTLSPGSKEYKSFSLAFLEDLRKHLVQKRWFDITYLGINENSMKDTKAAIEIIKRDADAWKITYAGNWHAEIDHLLDDCSLLLFHEPDHKELRERVQRGATTTFYVCCTPSKPNNFLFSPPYEGTWMGWYAAAYGYQGFLRWAYDAWTQDPVRDARHIYGPAGDCFLVYPGALSSIRFEKLREGIVDFEKIRILKSLFQNSEDEGDENAFKALQDHLNTFLPVKKEHLTSIELKINKGKDLINRMSVKGKPVSGFK